MDSKESRRIAVSLAYRLGEHASAAQIADAMVAILQATNTALTPIIGQRGVAALYRRSLHLCAAAQPCFAGTHKNADTSMDLTPLKSMLAQQSSAQACLCGDQFLKTFYELLTTLVGPSLTERLLRSVWENSLSGTPAQDTSP